MLQSLLSQTAEAEKLRVFLIIDNVSSQAFKLVVPHLYQILPSLSILRADPTCLNNFPVNGHASVATYFRLLLPSLLPAEIDRVLFIDADTVVTADLQELWHQPLQGKALGAVPEHISSCRDHNYTFGDYFNAGVMLVDLQRWRQADVLSRGSEFARANADRLRHWDQDVLNHVFLNDWLPIKDRWNACPHLFGLLPDISLAPEDLTRFEQEAIQNPAIIHFAGGGGLVKPWNARCLHPLRHHYLKVRSLTPWSSQPLDDAPPPKWRQIWDESFFRAKCRARQLMGLS
jgi:lipopolysaccharide biosynthesis glycosyltransferase